MRILTSLVIALFLATGVSPVLATSVPKRQKKQEHRIERGVKNGKITPKEAQRLRDQQATIGRSESQAKKDGKITGRERAEEQHDLNRAQQGHPPQEAQQAPRVPVGSAPSRGARARRSSARRSP